jgi:hypothetical protein
MLPTVATTSTECRRYLIELTASFVVLNDSAF